jgi:flagellin
VTVINTNVGALMARTYATKANDKMQTSMERLSSGLRINSAADDAAGMAVANKMSSQLSGIKMAIRNSQDGISLVQTAESGMGEITNMILRMRELAVQMENGIYTAKDRDNAQLEINALLAEVDKIATNTRFNDVAVLDGSYDQTIRAGNTNAETIRVNIGSLKTADNAKITNFALNRAAEYTGGTADGIDADGTDTDIGVTMGAGTTASVVEIDTSVFSTAFKNIFKQDSLGVFTLTGADAGNFSIDAKTGKVTSTAAMTASADANTASVDADTLNVVYTPRTSSGLSAHTEAIFLHVTAATEKTLSSIKVETSANATHAIETLDKALEEVSTAQAKLGAIQNRLSHNIDNLSKGSMLTEQSVGRIVDADFATETSELSKQQILAQAATSMLAQANQSKQSVLALLQ